MATVDSAPCTDEVLHTCDLVVASSASSAVPSSPAAIEIREFCAADYDDVLALFRDGMMHYAPPGHQHYQVWVDFVRNSLAGDLADITTTYVQRAGCNFFVATAAIASGTRQVVGTIAVERRSAELAELRRVSVQREFRRVGLGRLLVQHATQWAKRTHAYTQLTLSTAATQHAAMRFYESLGFVFDRATLLCTEPYFELAHFRRRIE